MEHRNGMQEETKPGPSCKALSSVLARVTFDYPPLNIFGPEAIPQLNEIVTAMETDKSLKVVVFDSNAVEGFFLTLTTSSQKLEDSTSLPPGPRDCSNCRICSCASVALPRSSSIAMIRGRATGVGSELALASDMRFVAAKRQSCRSGRLVRPSYPGAAPWRGCHV